MSTTTLVFLNKTRSQQKDYTSLYVSVLSIKDKISHTICKNSKYLIGELNGFEYEARCTMLSQNRNYILLEEGGQNTGPFLVELYNVSLKLNRNTLEKEYNYTVTVAKKVD